MMRMRTSKKIQKIRSGVIPCGGMSDEMSGKELLFTAEVRVDIVAAEVKY